MFGSNTYTIEFIPDGSELYTIDFEIDKPNKFKVTLTDETNFENSNYKIQLSNEKGLIIDEDNCDLIYEKLDKGLYNLKIMLNKGEIKNKIYIKLQCNDKIKINVNQENNNVLIIEDDKIFSDVYDQMKSMKDIFKRLQIFCNLKKLKLFSKADDSNIYYSKKEYKEEGGEVTFPNFYFDYINTKSGYHLKVINKFKFEKESDFIFSKSGEDLICKSKHGSYKITKDLTMTGFDKDFKEFLRAHGIEDDEIKLKDIVDDNIEETEEKEKKEEKGEDSSQNQKTKSCCCLIY
jgi:ribosomal protein L4